MRLKDRSEENTGACPEPYTSPLKQTQDWALLQCVVRGASPKPELEWQGSSGNTLPSKNLNVTERGGRYDVILQTNVTKTDTYRCVATQEDICHQVSAGSSIYIHGPPEPPGISIRGIVVSLVLGFLFIGALAGGCYYRKKKHLDERNRSTLEEVDRLTKEIETLRQTQSQP